MSEPFFLESDCEQIKFKRGVFDYVVTTPDDIKYISLAKANALIQERGTAVYGTTVNDEWGYCSEQHKDDTHRALLINIEPLEKDSAEKIVADLANSEFPGGWLELHDRARKLKGGV